MPVSTRLLSCLGLIAVTALSAPAAAQEPPAAQDSPEASGAPPLPEASPWPNLSFDMAGGFAYQFETGIDDGGDFEVSRFAIDPTLNLNFSPLVSLGIAVGYAQSDYEFSGDQGLGAIDPWDEIHSFRVGARLRWTLNDKWTLFGGPTIRWAGEDGADFDDSFFWGGFVGFSYKVSDTLSIGPGFGLLTQLEDDVSVFPIVFVNWKINDQLAVRTARGLGATRGPGVELAWEFAKGLELSVGGRYEHERFRLDDRGVAPNGVGDERFFLFTAALRYRIENWLDASVFVGAAFAGRLKVDDANGDNLISQDFDPSPLVGIVASIRF